MRRLAALFLLFASTAFAAVYNASNPIALRPGVTAVVWSAEQPTPGNGGNSASQQVSIGSGAGGFSVAGRFSGAPGAFEVDVQSSETDNDTDYQTISNGNITTVDATNQTFRLDCGTCVTRYVRLLMRSRTNAVNITARISQ